MINDDFDSAVKDLGAIVRAARLRAALTLGAQASSPPT
jgi:hypothetical protein